MVELAPLGLRRGGVGEAGASHSIGGVIEASTQPTGGGASEAGVTPPMGGGADGAGAPKLQREEPVESVLGRSVLVPMLWA
jgi:hypothetical protein